MRLENGVNVSIGDLLSTETFQMGKIHKEIAMFMVEAAKNEEYDDQRLVKVTMKFHCVYLCENRFTDIKSLHGVI